MEVEAGWGEVGPQALNEASGSMMGSGATPRDCPSPPDLVKTALWWGQRCPWQQFYPHNQPGGLDLSSQLQKQLVLKSVLRGRGSGCRVPLAGEDPPGRASSKVGDQGSGEGKMKNRPNSGPKTEAKLSMFSVHSLCLPIQEIVRKELSRVGSKTGVGDSERTPKPSCSMPKSFPLS